MNLRPAIILGGDYEMIAALGTRGVPVILGAEESVSLQSKSTFVMAVEQSSSRWSDEYLPWFESLLARYPDAAIFPWADASAWWLTQWADRNPGPGARAAVPPMAAFAQVAPKFRLFELCSAAGMAAPRTWLAPNVEAALAGAVGRRYPLIVKPQSRIGSRYWGQGQLVRTEAELDETVRWAIGAMRFREQVTQSLPGVDVPMVQEFVGAKDRPVYHLCGYLSGAGESAVLAHRKLLQAPRRFGNGLCFETAPVDSPLAAKLVAMLKSIGYRGIFEAEFLEDNDDRLLIDLNTRAYNGVRLEVERGFNLLWLAYLEACGETATLHDELARVASLPEQPGVVWCRRLEFAAMLGGQLAFGGFSPREGLRWAKWYRAHRAQMVDPWECAADRAIGRRRLGRQLYRWVTGPRAFLGTYVRRESGRGR